MPLFWRRCTLYSQHDDSHTPLRSTCFENIRELSKNLLGTDIVDGLSKIWGLDDEGELNGSYRPCGHPGVSASVYITCSWPAVDWSLAVVRHRGLLP